MNLSCGLQWEIPSDQLIELSLCRRDRVAQLKRWPRANTASRGLKDDSYTLILSFTVAFFLSKWKPERRENFILQTGSSISRLWCRMLFVRTFHARGKCLISDVQFPYSHLTSQSWKITARIRFLSTAGQPYVIMRKERYGSKCFGYATIVATTEGSHVISFVLFVSQTTPPLSVVQRAVYPKIWGSTLFVYR